MMKSMFKPAIWVMCQMRYPYKFMLLGSVALLTMAYLFYSVYSGLNQTVEYSRFKRSGNAAVESISRLVQALQQHRALSAAVLNGSDGMREARGAKEKEIGELLDAAGDRLPSALQGSDGWKRISGDWARLKADGLQLAPPDNFSSHTGLIDKILTFNVDVADESTLTFDPDVDTYYLVDTTLTKLPLALERLGQIRARGMGILTRKQITEQQKIELSSLVAEVNYALRSLRHNLEKTARYSPALAPAIGTAADGIATASAQVLKLVIDDIIGGTFTTTPKDYFDLTTAVIDQGYKQAHDTLQPALRSLIEARAERAQQQLLLTLSISLTMLATIGYFGAGAYYATIDNVTALAAGARRIAGGDLTVRIDLDTRDEHKLVGDSFNEMAAAFRKLLHNVQQNAQQVLDTAMRIAESSSQISRSTTQQSESASGMAASVEEMSNGVENISHNARNAHGLSTEAGALSAQGGDIVGTVVAGIEKIAEAVNESASIIENLGYHSDQISTIVGVIKEIADQTNLLALNAAIEAARAGESGRGFAVVADEVRKLAERTTQSTQEITGMIAAIQNGTQSAVSSMQDGVERVNEGVQLARQAGDAMQQIQGSARQVVEMVSDISTALHEQSAAGSDIARNVEIIARMAEENSAAVAANAATAERLEQLASMLETEVRPYKIA